MTGPLRVVIAEDESGSRARLRQLIQRAPDLTLVGECRNGREAIDAVRRTRPAVVFLDVQMPGLDGFDVLNGLGGERPVIVFVTAFDQYAVRAFDVNAADYLLKPFDDGRFARAMGRVRAALAARGHQARSTPAPAMVRPGASRLAVHCGSVLRFLETSTITKITAEDCYARIHADDDVVLVRESLSSLETRLPDDFRRIHRSTVVNARHVSLIAPVTHGDLRLRLSDGSEVRVSRRYRKAIGDLGIR